ncbi:MAG: cation:proton antiporter, partial [Spirochaetota bacterium]
MEAMAQILAGYRHWAGSLELPVVLMLGIFIIAGRLFAMLFEKIRLPSIVGLLIGGVVLGSSLLNLIDGPDLERLSFLSNLTLAFVALSLGLEFKRASVQSLGT